jgi:hypothetical protein
MISQPFDLADLVISGKKRGLYVGWNGIEFHLKQ